MIDAEKYLWLEDLDTPDVLEWVTARNAETTAGLAGERFARTRDAIREVLDSKDRIPYPRRRGDGFYYDFWTDADHPRGLWRRTTLERLRRDEPEWEVLFDVGALNRAEGGNWTWKRVDVLRPGYHRGLISLSRGGADAAVVREFDLGTRSFVDPADGGFTLPEAKSDVCWIDADHLLVATDFGPGSLTSSGYPRIVKRWRRGTPLSAAETVFEGGADDVLSSATYDPTPGYERGLVTRMVSFYRNEYRLYRPDGRLADIDVPEDAVIDMHREWLLVSPRSAWTAGGVTYPAGSLVAVDLEAFLAGGGEPALLFEPDERTSLRGWSWTRNHLLLATMSDVRTRIEIRTPAPGAWGREPVAGAGELDQVAVLDTEPGTDDAYLLSSEGFLDPVTLSLGEVGGDSTVLKRGPAFFGTDGMTVRQFFATSADGTRIPYFVAGGDGPGPTILYGYGGFEVTMSPSYSGLMGRGWLAHGGTYVLAGIRGGGEYGPAWHQAALRENRPRAFEDFAAVAADLVARGITTPRQLGILGGSNGGLLMGVMLTRYPELFGAVVARVPLLDMRRYTKLLAGKSWIAEYGDPDVAEDWAYLREFSPLQNVLPDRSYPPLLLLTSTRDDRVHPAHARKMKALLDDLGHRAGYYENVEGGHGGAADNEQAALLWALTFEFLWRELTP